MSEEGLRTSVALLTVLFISWILGFALYARRRHNIQAVAVSAQQTSPWQRILLLTAIVFDGYLIVRALVPAIDRWALAFASPAPFLALALMLAGGLAMVATHLHMGASWRIGVPRDGGNIAALVTTGPHRFSRNPIYLGILVMMTGAAIAAPGPLTLGCLIVTFFGMQSIIAEEEIYLGQQFGGDYNAYRRCVRRWI